MLTLKETKQIIGNNNCKTSQISESSDLQIPTITQ